MHRAHRHLLQLACGLCPWGEIAPQQSTPPPGPWRFAAFLWHDSPNDLVALDGIRRGLDERGRGYELAELRAREDVGEARRLLAELAASPPDLVFVLGTQAALLAAEALRTVPVVFTAVTHPVASKVVADWSGSGRNLAGNSNWIAPETVLEVFRLAVPHLRVLGVLRSTSSGVVSAAEVAQMSQHLAGHPQTAIELAEVAVADAAEIAAAVDRIAAARADALWVPIDFLVYEHMSVVLDAAAKHRLPIVSSSLRGTRDGAFAGIVVDYQLLGERAVVIALDILERGADPGTIPVGRMAGYRVVVNLGAARRCGYEVPLSLMVLADELLEDLEPQERSRAGGR